MQLARNVRLRQRVGHRHRIHISGNRVRIHVTRQSSHCSTPQFHGCDTSFLPPVVPSCCSSSPYRDNPQTQSPPELQRWKCAREEASPPVYTWMKIPYDIGRPIADALRRGATIVAASPAPRVLCTSNSRERSAPQAYRLAHAIDLRLGFLLRNLWRDHVFSTDGAPVLLNVVAGAHPLDPRPARRRCPRHIAGTDGRLAMEAWSLLSAWKAHSSRQQSWGSNDAQLMPSASAIGLPASSANAPATDGSAPATSNRLWLRYSAMPPISSCRPNSSSSASIASRPPARPSCSARISWHHRYRSRFRTAACPAGCQPLLDRRQRSA